MRRFNESVFPLLAIFSPLLLSVWLIAALWFGVVIGFGRGSGISPEIILTRIFAVYLLVQGLGALFRSPRQVGRMVGDIALSLAPVFVVGVAMYAWNARLIIMTDYKWAVSENVFWYCLLVDVVIFSWLMAKINYYAGDQLLESGTVR